MFALTICLVSSVTNGTKSSHSLFKTRLCNFKSCLLWSSLFSRGGLNRRGWRNTSFIDCHRLPVPSTGTCQYGTRLVPAAQYVLHMCKNAPVSQRRLLQMCLFKHTCDAKTILFQDYEDTKMGFIIGNLMVHREFTEVIENLIGQYWKFTISNNNYGRYWELGNLELNLASGYLKTKRQKQRI